MPSRPKKWFRNRFGAKPARRRASLPPRTVLPPLAMAFRRAGGTHKHWLIDALEAIDEACIRGQTRRLAIWVAMQSLLGFCRLGVPVGNTREVLTLCESVVNFI